MYFVEVILPLPLPKTFTYTVTEAEFNFIAPGMRIAVPFGTNKMYAALAVDLHQNPPQQYEARQIEYILDETPVANQQQLDLWKWMAHYYMCPIGDIYRCAFPSGLLLESDTYISKNPEHENTGELTDEEYLIFEALERQSALQMQEIMQILNKKSVFPVVRKMLDKGIILVQESLSETYAPKYSRHIRLASAYRNPEGLQKLLEALKKSEKQRLLVMKYFNCVSDYQLVPVKTLLEGLNMSSSVLKSLIEKGVFEVHDIQEGRVNFSIDTIPLPQLSGAQQQALDKIHLQFEEKEVNLLFGVTSSGKTEIYINLIQDYLDTGKQVLYLLPEIALTTQLVGRLVKYFGNQVTVYHSKYSSNERVEAWHKVLTNSSQARIVVGARSALFLPFAKLGLIIVDEEHEQTFKQFDPSPRYHARDAAVVLAKQVGAKVLLGSATPALETYYNAISGKYGKVELTERYGNVAMPEIVLVDLKEKSRKKQMSGHFSDTLIDAIQSTLNNRGQVILFQNRRGFSRLLECMTCGHVPQCTFCDVSLTYHLSRNQLRCHYCGYNIMKPNKCLACASADVNTKGFGTEQVQEELSVLFPKAKVERMDQDTTRGKYSFNKLIDGIKSGTTDILVGTQMLAKGLDFENVRLVGIMNADNLLNQPDFRAYERSYQMMAQVAGRSGRTGQKGSVIIQSYFPQHTIMQQVINNDYDAMFNEQIGEREKYKYPPFYKIIRLTLRQRDFEKVQAGAKWLHSVLLQKINVPVLGPEEPPVGRIRNEYLRNIMIKVKVGQPLEQTKKTVQKIVDSFHAIPQYRSVKVVVNVDPY